MSHADDKRTWRSIEERDGLLEPTPDLNDAIRKEFLDGEEGMTATRRSFLRLAGFGVAATAAGCSRGEHQAVLPQTAPDETVIPGRAYWIASSSSACAAGCGTMVRCRDGRPVKLEGNPDHPVNGGGLCPSCQASLLGLYDSHRISGVRGPSGASSWDQLTSVLASATGTVRVLTGTLNSPSALAAVNAFIARANDGRHVMYDALSVSAILSAHASTHGARVLPHYDFGRAKVIASFDADFLGTWISPVEFTRDYVSGRKPDAHPPVMSRHWQFESRLSLTGSRADKRVRTAPWQTRAALELLCDRIGGGHSPAGELPAALASAIEELATELRAHKGESLVVCGSNDLALQLLVNRANAQLGAYGATVDVERPSKQCLGDDAALAALGDELASGKVDMLIMAGCNPAYDVPGFAEAIANAGTVVSLGSHADETAALATWSAANLHDLESWNDAETVSGVFSFTQPTVAPMRDGRTLRQLLRRAMGDTRPDRDILRSFWSETMAPQLGVSGSFDVWFEEVLQSGFTTTDRVAHSGVSAYRHAKLPPATTRLPTGGELALVLYAKSGMLDGRNAHNPWLQELPDPVSKVVWDNYAALSPDTAEARGLATGDMVDVAANGQTIEVPVVVQPGQHDGVVAVALGYGRIGTDRFAKVGPEWIQGRDTIGEDETVGTNASPLLRFEAGAFQRDGLPAVLTATGGKHDIACTQDYHSLTLPPDLAPKGHETRDAARTVGLASLAGSHDAHGAEGHGPGKDLWPDDHVYEGHRWGMAIDLSACTGCSGCVIGCQAENNVPVVGKDEVRRHREMSWIRIDRYYQGDDDDLEVRHQPMMCQHCTRAGCETVCPVLATMHSSEGLNQQVYNRCVGTRYCANNCAYKVRRFNWFDYPHEDRLQNMALNPDVTVRSRGVMEKCSMCIQRIQGAKAEASREGRELSDGDIKVACQQSCPADAIVFGDLNDPESAVSKAVAGNRAYSVLAELNTGPVVNYLTKVVNADTDHKESKHG